MRQGATPFTSDARTWLLTCDIIVFTCSCASESKLSLHRVDLRDPHSGILREILQVEFPLPSPGAAAVRPVLRRGPAAFLVAHGHREVVAPDGERARVDVPVDGALADAEGIRRRDRGVVDAPPPVEGGHGHLVDGPGLPLCCVDPLSGRHRRVAVLPVRDPVQVVELAQAAPLPVRASVADVRRGREARARLPLEPRAGAAAASQAAAGAVPRAVRPSAQPVGPAAVAVYAGAEPSPVERPGRLLPVVHDFAFGGGARDAGLAPDLRERLALPDRGLRLEAQVVGEAPVSFLSDGHVGLLCLAARRDCRAGVKDAIFAGESGRFRLHD